MESIGQTEAKNLFCALQKAGLTVSTAESCTGGLIAKLLTDLPGSSAVFAGGCVSYTNAVKTAVLGVDAAVIDQHTEVSFACAEAMANGARALFGTDLAVATTGYAGPGGGMEKDPVGTVYLAVSSGAGCVSERFCAPQGSTRGEVRALAAARVMAMACAILNAG